MDREPFPLTYCVKLLLSPGDLNAAASAVSAAVVAAVNLLVASRRSWRRAQGPSYR